MKYSKQRELIFNTVLWSNDHPTAEMVYNVVRKEIPNISLGTVYRNLNQLVEHNMLKKVFMPGESDRFDKTLEHHNHVYCEQCHQVFDIPVSNLAKINQAIEHEIGFRILSHDIIFKGVCKDCAKREYN